MWELVKRSLQRERTMTAAQLGRPRRASVQRMHNEIVEAFLKAGRQRVRRTATGRLGSFDSVAGEGPRVRGARGGRLWRAVSSLGFALAMAIRLLNPYVLISVAFGQHRSLMAHLSARVDSMRAALSPRIGRRRRLTAWVHGILPQRKVPEAASAVWQDGSLLCGIVEAAVPGSCPGYDSLSPPNADRGATLWLGQKLAARYLGVPPAFSDDEFSQACLTVYMERRMLRYLAALKAASVRVEVERQRRLEALQVNGGSPVEEDAFSLDTIAHSSLPPGESLLECVARGMGLLLGVQGRKSTFYLYLNPNHPHRHVHRLMQRSNTVERQHSFDKEAGTILMQIRGPEGDFGAALLSTSPGSSSTTMGPSLEILKEQWYGRIPIFYETTEESVTVSFVPQSSGRHELILLQRGGSHVPGSPFSITVEDSSEVPDENGTRRRFGSEPVGGLAVPETKGMTKAVSYESGLDRGHRRIDSGGSDPGTISEGYIPGGIRKRRRVVVRVVDFVTEKMLLTDDGKLERLPKRRRRDLERMSNEYRVSDYDFGDASQSRRYSTLYNSWGRIRRLEIDEPTYGTYPGRRSPVEYGMLAAVDVSAKSGFEVDAIADEHSDRSKRGKDKTPGDEKMMKVSDVVSANGNEGMDSINFRDHCRRILWLCDILLKHSPHQESLEMLNTAGDILEGKRVHPTILEESEAEEAAAAVATYTATVRPTLAQTNEHEAPTRPAPTTYSTLAQRLQRASSDTGGLNEVSAWKESRRQFHSWSRKDREGGGTGGGRLIHKGGSYRGVVVRDMTPEALTGAYAGGDDPMEDEGSPRGGESEFWGAAEEEKYLLEVGIPEPRMSHHSLPKRRRPGLAKQMENKGHSEETLEQRRPSTPDREKDGGRTTVIGKELNKSITPNNKGQINYSDRDSERAQGEGTNEDREKRTEEGASMSEKALKDYPRRHSEKEDKRRPSGVGGKNIILAAAVALAEGGGGGGSERVGESWEETLSNIGTREISGEERDSVGDDKEFLVASSKEEPSPVQDFKEEGKGEGDEDGKGGEAVACAEETGEKDEDERGTRRESAEPASAEVPGAGEINERLPPPPPHPSPPAQPPPPPTTTHDPGAERSPESPEGMVSKSSDVAGSVTSSGSGYPRTISEVASGGEERGAIKEQEGRDGDEKETEEIEEELDDGEAVEGEVVTLKVEEKAWGEVGMETPEMETEKEYEKELMKDKEKGEETTEKSGEVEEKEVEVEEHGLMTDNKKGEEEAENMEEVDVKEVEEAETEEHEKYEDKLHEEPEESSDNAGEIGERKDLEIAGDKSMDIREGDVNVDYLEGREENTCVVEENTVKDETVVEPVDKSKEDGEEGFLPENAKEEEIMLKHKENETPNIGEYNQNEIREGSGKIDGSDAVKEEEKGKNLQSRATENVMGEAIVVKDVEIKSMDEKIEETNLSHFAEGVRREETENITGKALVQDQQAIVMREDVVIVEKTNAGNEDLVVELKEVKNEEKVGGTEGPVDPKTSTISQVESEVIKRGTVVEDNETRDEVLVKIIIEVELQATVRENGEEGENSDGLKGNLESKLNAKGNVEIEREKVGKDRHENVETEGSREEFIEDKCLETTDLGKESSEIEEMVIIEKMECDAESKPLKGEMETVEVEEKSSPLQSKKNASERAKVKVGHQQDPTDDVPVNSERSIAEDRLEREFLCEGSCGIEIAEDICNTEESENEKAEKSHATSYEGKSVRSALKHQVEKEESRGRGAKLQIGKIHGSESGKMLEETEPEEGKSIERGKDKERFVKDQTKNETDRPLREDKLNDEEVNIVNVQGIEFSDEKQQNKDGEIMVKSPSEGEPHDMEESKILGEYFKTMRSHAAETKKNDIFEDLTPKEGGGTSQREHRFLEIGTIFSKENAGEEMDANLSDENGSKKSASEGDGTVTEEQESDKIVAPREQIMKEEEKNEEKGETLKEEVREEQDKENETLGKNEFTEGLKDTCGEEAKVNIQIEIPANDGDLEKVQEYAPKEEKEIEASPCLKMEKIPPNKDREGDKKEFDDELVNKMETKYITEETPIQVMEKEKNEIKGFKEKTPTEGDGELRDSTHDEKTVREDGNHEKITEEIKKIEGEAVFEEKILENELLQNVVIKEEFKLDGMESESIAYKRSHGERRENFKQHGSPSEEKIQEEVAIKVSPKEELKVNDILEVNAEKREEEVEIEDILCEESKHGTEENMEECNTQGEKVNASDVSRQKEIGEENNSENTNKKELTLEKLETEITAIHKESQKEEKDRRDDYDNEVKEENEHLRDVKLLENLPDTIVLEAETEGGKSQQTMSLEENSVKSSGNVLVAPANENEVEVEIKYAEKEETLRKERINNKVDVSENILVVGENSEKRDEEEICPSTKEETAKEGKFTESTPRKEEKKEKESPEIGETEEEEKWVKSSAPDPRVQALNLTGAEDGRKKEVGEEGCGECREAERIRDKSGLEGGKAEGVTSETEKCSKEEEEPGAPQREGSTAPGEGASSLTYGEIIGRIIYTDSFSSDSLEWYEEKERKWAAEAVEGTMERVEGISGASMAVGNEAWEEPEISREEPFREAGGPERPETYGKEATVIGGDEEGAEAEEKEELDEEEGRDPWSTGPPSNLDEDKVDDMEDFQRKCAEVGSSLRVGVGVVVAGGIVSRRDSSSEGGGRDTNWRRSQWRASRSKSIEEGLPLPKEDPAGQQWEEICMGIDAMEDRSISEVIEEVSGKRRRRRRTRKERCERSGKAADERRRGREGDAEAAAAGPAPSRDSLEAEDAEREEAAAAVGKEGRCPASGPTKVEEGREEAAGGGGSPASDLRGEVGAKEEGSIGAEPSREKRVGMLSEQWWLSSSSRSGSLGGVKIEELRVDWVGAMEEGKMGRGPAEEEGVEAKEDAEAEDKAKGGEGRRDEEEVGGKIFSGDKRGEGDSITETPTPKELGIIVADAKMREHSPPITESNIDSGKRAGEKEKDENVKEITVEALKQDDDLDTSSKCELIDNAEDPKRMVSILEEEEVESDVEVEEAGEKEGEEIVDAKDENENTTKTVVPSSGEDKSFIEDIKAELEETKPERIFERRESDKTQRDNETKGPKSMQSAGDGIFLDLESKYSPSEVECPFGSRFANRGKFSPAEGSGEWEFVDTGTHFTENTNDEGRILGEVEEKYPCDKCANSTEGLLLGSVLGNKDNVQSPGAVGMGIEKVNELLKSFVDISTGEERASADGTSFKREGEELYGVQMTLDEWEGGKRQDYKGQETEVIVGDFDLLGDWEGGEEAIGIFVVSTKEHGGESDRKEVEEEEVEGKTEGKGHEIHVEGYEYARRMESKVGDTENESESSNVSVEEESKSHRSQTDESTSPKEDDDIEEIERTEPDEWSGGGFSFTDHRSTFRNLEDLLGGDISFRMTACTAQFNLWPSQEAFGGKGTWMEHIDVDAFMSTAQSGHQPSGTGLLKNMTTFAKTCVVGDNKGSSRTTEQYQFSRDGAEKIINVNSDEEEEIVLEEQDFDDRSDEIQGALEPGPNWGSTYRSFDTGSHKKVNKGDAFIIYESPGITTFANQDDEMSSDDEADEKPVAGKNVGKAYLCDDDLMEGLELDGEWEEGVIFLDDDDDNDMQTEGRRGSGEYRKFGGEVVEKEETELWGSLPQADEDTAARDVAFAIVMDSEDINDKTPVLPTGRWCPRLPILSPAMSAISEEDGDEIFPEKEEKEEEGPVTVKTDNEDGRDTASENRDMNEYDGENNFQASTLSASTSRDQAPEDQTEGFDKDEGGGRLKVKLCPDDEEMNQTQADGVDGADPIHDLPKLDVEIEDGFGESFSQRRSSTSSVLSDSGTVEPVADCGAAFVVSSELAVTLALGVLITQIIPPVIDLPEIPPLPQVDEATDALSIGKCEEEPSREKGSEEGLEAVRKEGIGQIVKDDDLVKKTTETQTDPVIALKEVKVFVDSSTMVEEDVLKIETTIIEKAKQEGKELENQMRDGFGTFNLEEDDVEKKSYFIKEKECLAPECLPLKKQGDGKERHIENSQVRERAINEVIGKEKDGYDIQQMEDNLSSKTGARRKIPEISTESIEDYEIADSRNRDFIVLEREVVGKDEKMKREVRDIGEENGGEGNRGRFLLGQQECNWSNGMFVTKTFPERQNVEHKNLEEEEEKVVVVFEEKQKSPEKDGSVLPTVETGGENNRRAESTTKSSSPGGVRKKESLEETTKESPPRTIPLEKLLGWSSENGNGNGLGCPEVASRRESVFDDYNFSLWENGFKLDRDPESQRIKSQDSTGLEYYLDVDQLLNVPLAATEPEVKYVSAKEIMDSFTRGEGIDSPEKIVEKEVESRREKIFKSDSQEEGATGGVPIEFLSGGIMGETAGFSSELGNVAVCMDSGEHSSDDDLFAEFSQGSLFPAPKARPVQLPQIFMSLEDTTSFTSWEGDQKCSQLMDVMDESVKPNEEEKDLGENNDNLNPDLKIEETLDLIADLDVEKETVVEMREPETLFNRTRGETDDISNKGIISETGAQREIPGSGRKVRNMIGIFERPASTKIETETTPVKETKGDKSPLLRFGERTPKKEIERLPSAAVAFEVDEIPPAIHGGETTAPTEREDEAVSTTTGDGRLTLSPLESDATLDVRMSEIERSRDKQEEESGAVSSGRTPGYGFDELITSEATGIFTATLAEVKSPTIDDRREALLSLSEEPVVGWEAIKVATEVEKIIMSTGNGVELKKKIMGGVVIGADPDKIFGTIEPRPEAVLKDSESGKNLREPTEPIRSPCDSETKPEGSKVGGGGGHSGVQDEARKPRAARLSTSSSFEEYRTVVVEAYQFLEGLGDTVDEDEERVMEEEVAKEPGGRAEDSTCGVGSEVEEFHPCEELPDGGRKMIPRGVDGASSIAEGLPAEDQSSESSPERCKTAESSSSSSPYSSLPTFADVSSGILSSASSKDDNFSKVEDGGAPRRERAHKTELPEAAVGAGDDGSALTGDYPEGEIDSSVLAKMNVASRKEYWDRRLRRAQEKRKEVVTTGSKKPSPFRVSGIVARGRMSFEKSRSRDDYTTSDSGGDGGKSSSSESSPSSRGKLFYPRPKSIHSRGTKSTSVLKTEVKAQETGKSTPSEEKKIAKTSKELLIGGTGKGGDDTLDKEIPTRASEAEQEQQPLGKLEDKEDLSQIPVSKRKEIWDQKLQKMSEDESPPSSLEHKISHKIKSSRVESTKKLLGNLSTEDKTDTRAPSSKVKGTVPKYKQELEEKSQSIDSSSADDKVEGEGVVKKSSPIKTTGSVSRLAKLFSSPSPEPQPIKYGRGRGKYSKDLDKVSKKSTGESVEESSAKTETPTHFVAESKAEISHPTTDTSGADSRLWRQNESSPEKISTEKKDEKKTECDRRTSSSDSTKMTDRQDTDNSSSIAAEKNSSESENVASRRKRYLQSVQQSLEGEEARKEVKKSESEDSTKGSIGGKGISDVRNIWEKRASLDGSESTSESIKKSGKMAGKSSSANRGNKNNAQDEKPVANVKLGSSGKTYDQQLQGEAPIRDTEGGRQVNLLLEKPISHEEQVTSAVSSTPREIERREGENFPIEAVSRHGAYLESGRANEAPTPSSNKNTGGSEGESTSCGSRGLGEGKPSSNRESSQKTIQSTNKNAQQPDPRYRDDERKKLPSSVDKPTKSDAVKATDKSLQRSSKVSPEERRDTPAPSPAGKRSPPETDRKVASSETPTTPFRGRRHSSACINPLTKTDVSKMRERWGSLEEKGIESMGSKGKRDSVEIRVTDDDDICVMREYTSVPRFPPKDKMETHEEEDGRQVMEGGEVTAPVEDERSRAPQPTPPPSSTGAKRRNLPPRTISIQVSGIVASGRRMFETGKAIAEDMPTLSEESSERAAKFPATRKQLAAPRRGAEEGRRTPTRAEGFKEAFKEEEEEEAEPEAERGRRPAPAKSRRLGVERETPKGEEGGGRPPRPPEAGGRELFRAVPVSVTVEGEHTHTDIRVEICDSEEPSPASKGGEGGDDGRSATSRRAPKGKEPAKNQPPPSAASSPDTESEGAAETKLLSFLSTPAAQVRRHSAVDVATLRSFSAAPHEEGPPRMRRRGSGDLGSPARPKEDESKKRFSRARQFFETLEKGKESPPSGAEDDAPTSKAATKKKKKKAEEEEGAGGRASLGRRAGSKHRPHAARSSKDSSESTTESDKEKQHRRKVRKGTAEKTHSLPGSDVDSSGGAPQNHPSLHRRKRERECVLRSQRFGGSEREVKVSERFNVMDLFRDVAGPGTGVTSGRATPLGIPHQAAVLAALRSVEDVRSTATTSPYDMYRPVEADNDCEPSVASAAEDDGGERAAASANDENANVEEEGNVTFSSPMTLCVKREYQAEYPHLPMSSPRHSRHRSSNTDLIPRNVLLQLDTNQNTPKKSSSSRRSIAELF